MKKLPIGVQTFSELILKNYVYIDKTALIHYLITMGKAYFLARPRRFGKSLLISTFQTIFEGKRELFKDLAIDQLDYDWAVRPVVRIDLSGIGRTSPELFYENLKKYLMKAGKECGVELDHTDEPSGMLGSLIKEMYAQNGPVVLLIDEYDKPLLDHLSVPAAAEKMRATLRNLYEVCKPLDEYLHFIFITGVSKFTQTSLFSGLNNLHDLSVHPRYATLCGYTRGEIEKNFILHIQAWADQSGQMFDDVLSDLEKWYNGYSFKWGCEKVFNPFSVLNALDSHSLSNYWILTGTPNFLATMFKQENPLPQLNRSLRVTGEDLVITGLDKLPMIPVLTQTGYLTFVGEDRTGCELGFPNHEVSSSYAIWGLASTCNTDTPSIRSLGGELRKQLGATNIDEFFKLMIPLFASIPVDIQVVDREKYYQSVIYLVCLLVGIDMDVELSTNIGIIDAVVKTDIAIIIIEFKLRGTAQEALDQIKANKYYERFLADTREIILVGAQFCMQKRNIVAWIAEPKKVL